MLKKNGEITVDDLLNLSIGSPKWSAVLNEWASQPHNCNPEGCHMSWAPCTMGYICTSTCSSTSVPFKTILVLLCCIPSALWHVPSKWSPSSQKRACSLDDRWSSSMTCANSSVLWESKYSCAQRAWLGTSRNPLSGAHENAMLMAICPHVSTIPPTMENHNFLMGKSTIKWRFSMAMSNYQRDPEGIIGFA